MISVGGRRGGGKDRYIHIWIKTGFLLSSLLISTTIQIVTLHDIFDINSIHSATMDIIKILARHEGHDHSDMDMDMSGMDMGSNTTSSASASSMDMGAMSSCKSESFHTSPHHRYYHTTHTPSRPCALVTRFFTYSSRPKYPGQSVLFILLST